MTAPHGQRPHVVIVGGGFGGLSAVRALRRHDLDVTLVDKRAYNTFQPLLYQVATATLNPGDVTYFQRAVRAVNPRVRFRLGEVVSMDHTARTVTLDTGDALAYDHLIISAGVTANFFGIPGAQDNALPIYTRDGALDVRTRLFTGLEAAATEGDGHGDVRVVVVGGGATGVETAGALAEMRNHDLQVTYPELDPKRTHVTLVEMAPVLLGAFHEGSQVYAKESLEKRGVDLRLGTKVAEVRPDGVVVGDGELIPAGLVIWASGIAVADAVADWGVPQGKGGRILVDDHLRVQGLPDVYAVGDIALDEGNALPQLAQPALQGGKYVAKQIAGLLAGAPEPPPFRYRDKGSLATIGRSAAVAEISHVPDLKGFPAWAVWTGVHVFSLLGNRNRAATMVNLTAKYAFWNKSHNAIVGDLPTVRERARQRRAG